MKAVAIHELLDGELPAQFSYSDCPSRRELEIQIAKLERMFDVFSKKFRAEREAIKTSADMKKFRRKVGPEIAKLGQQAKKMQGLFYKTIEESFFLREPHTELTRKQFRRALTTVNRNFEKTIYASVQQLQKQLSAASEQKHLKP